MVQCQRVVTRRSSTRRASPSPWRSGCLRDLAGVSLVAVVALLHRQTDLAAYPSFTGDHQSEHCLLCPHTLGIGERSGIRDAGAAPLGREWPQLAGIGSHSHLDPWRSQCHGPNISVNARLLPRPVAHVRRGTDEPRLSPDPIPYPCDWNRSRDSCFQQLGVGWRRVVQNPAKDVFPLEYSDPA